MARAWTLASSATFRSWGATRPDDGALSDPAIELVLPEAAELSEIQGDLLAPNALPGLWTDEEITVQTVIGYFDGSRVVQVDRGGDRAATDVGPGAMAWAVGSGGRRTRQDAASTGDALAALARGRRDRWLSSRRAYGTVRPCSCAA